MSSSPWSVYSGFISPILSDAFTEYSIIFDMNVSDSQARIAFDLGISTTDVAITQVVLEELQLASLSVTDINKIESKVFPNPVSNLLNIYNYNDFKKLTIYNLQGQIIQTKDLKLEIDLQYLKTGIYIVTLKGDNILSSLKMIKH